MKILLYTLFGIGLIIPNSSKARPVSYPSGITFMQMNNGDMNSAHIHYSPTAKYSVGYKFEYWREDDFTLNAVQVNNLIKRWNKKDSQANFYLKSGAGNAEGNAAGFSGIALDWEDRRYFTSYENRYTEGAEIDGFYQQSARVGIAPYIGDYGDLHTWLMLQIDHMPEADKNVTATPLVRLFKGVHLVEAGMNTNGEVLFNYVLRY